MIRKSTSVTMNVNNGSDLFKHPVNRDSVRVSQHAQQHDPETKAVVINFNISTCAFPFFFFCEKATLYKTQSGEIFTSLQTRI